MNKNIRKIILIMAIAIVMTALLSVSAFAARDAVGDLNRDGVKDSDDAIHLLYHSNFSEIYEVDQPCDYDKDGDIDSDDAIFLLFNTNFPDVYVICEHPDNKWSVKEVVAPTCKEKGYTVMICECGEEEITNYTDISEEHVWGEPDYTNQATCLENGYITETCTVCRKVQTTQQQATGHDWTEGSCTEAKNCKNCDATVAAIGHVFGTEPVETVPATCMGGYNVFKCENCDETTKVDLDPIDHRVDDKAWRFTREEAVEGVKCSYVYVEENICLDCEETVYRNSDSFVKHNETTTVTEATCVTKGEKVVKCKDCGKELKRETIEINTNHNWVEDTENSTASVTAYKCSAEGCTATKTAAKLSADGKVDIGTAEEVELDNGAAIVPDEKTKEQLGGSNVSVSVGTVDADEVGLSTEEKELLGGAPIYNLEMADENDEPIENFDGTMTVRLPYKLSEGEDPDCIIIWYIDEDETTGEVSIEYYEAKYINGYAVFETTHFSYYTVTRMTPAQRCATYGHNYETTDVPATCVTGGYTLDICTRCGDKKVTNPTDALGHDWDVEITKAASCTEKGTETYTCKRCEINFEKSIGALGHSYKAEEELGKTDRYTAPSCTAKGEHYMVCERCDKEYKEDLAQLEHEYETEEFEADCENGGYKKNKCKHCGDEYDSDHTKPKGHAYGKDGKCGHCKKVCAHEYKYGVCTHCNCEKEKPNKPDEPKPEEPDHEHKFEHTYEFINEELRYCEVGVVITKKCTECDYTETFTTFEHYAWEVEVDLSEYDICDSHAIHYRRCACIEGEFEWIEDLEFDGDQFMIENGMGVKCKDCEFTVHMIYMEEETDCYEMLYQKIGFLVGDKEIHVVEATLKETYHELEDAEVTFDNGATSCEGGVTVKGTCSVCGETVEYKVYDHFYLLTTNYDLTQYGACENHYMRVASCACGAESYCYTGGFSSSTSSSDPMGNQTITRSCQNCNVTVETKTTGTQIGENCVHTTTQVITIKANGEVKETVTIKLSEIRHQWTVTEIDYAEGSSSCEEGLIITRTCENCGAKNTESRYGHYYEYGELDLSGYSVCKHHYISCQKCVGCDKIIYIDYGNFDHYGDYIGCENCDLKIYNDDVYGEKDENCRYTVYRKTTVFYGDEALAECVSEGFREDHDYEYSFEYAEGSTSCEEGVYVIQRCKDCGDEYTELYNEHYFQEQHFEFPEGDVCEDHNVFVFKCVVCDYIEHYGFNNLAWDTYETENGFAEYYFCDKCDLVVTYDYTRTEKNDNCEIGTEGVLTIKNGDEIVFTSDYSELWTEHNYKRTAQLMPGATTCFEGIIVTYTCEDCGYSYTRERYEHVTEDVRIDLEEHGACDYHEIYIYQCVGCGEVYDFSRNGFSETYIDGEWVWVCPEEACDINIRQHYTYGEKDENCRQNVVRDINISCGEEEIESFTIVENWIDHEWEYTFEFEEGATSCKDGYTVYMTCKDCGENDSYKESGHNTYDIIRIKLSDHGHVCGTGEITIYQCPCGYEWHISLSGHDGFSTHRERDKNGIVIYRYVCDTCGYEYTRKNQTVKDEFCNATYIVEIALPDGEVLEYSVDNGKSHNTTSKMLPDESYTDKNADGSYTEVVAYEEYCSDCLASITKYIETFEYNAKGQVVAMEREHYNYVALSETETVAVLSNIESNTYIIVDNMYGNDYTRVDDVIERRYYDENGKETLWEKYEFIYDGDYCNYTVKYTDSHGNESFENESDYHRQTMSKYVLSEGSNSCVDGIDRIECCLLCGREAYREEKVAFDHELFANEMMLEEQIDFRDYGAVCETYLNKYSCPCGEEKRIERYGDCEMVGEYHYDYDDDGIEHVYYLYTCAVTDPDTCGFKFVKEYWYTSDDNCDEIVHYVYYIGLDENNENSQNTVEFDYKTGGKRHTNIDVVETVTDECWSTVEKCLACGTLLNETEIKDNIKTYTYYYYNGDGSLYRKNVSKYIYPSMYYNDDLLLYRRYEHYDAEGNIYSWSQVERTYPRADEGNYCYYEYVNTNSRGMNETGSDESHRMYWHGSNSCTPVIVEHYCYYCDYTESEWDSGYGHDFRYDDAKGVFVCSRCELESAAGGNGSVIFEDKSLTEGDGSEYIIGWYNNYGDSYIWNVALVVEGAEDFIFLDDISVEEIGDYRLKVDAAAINKLASEKGLEPCQYMVRIAFVPTDGDGTLDYAITLDPHVFVEDVDNTVIPEECGEYVYAYKCAYCDETKTVTKYGHYYDSRTTYSLGYNEDGYWTITKNSTSTCRLCGEMDTYSSYESFLPNGKYLISENPNSNTTYEYDYEAGVFYEYQEDYKYEQRTIKKYDMATEDLLYYYWENTTYGNSEEYYYMWVDRNQYCTKETITDRNGFWHSFTYEYDFDNDIKVESYTDSDSPEPKVIKYRISTGEQIYE